MENKSGYSDVGNVQRKMKTAIPMWKTPDEKIKMAVPMRDGDFENQNTVSRCGTAVLKTEWDFPDAGRSDLKQKRSNND